MECEVVAVRIDDEIVEVAADEAIQQVAEDVVHEMLKRCGRISQAEVHDEELIGAIARAKGGFVFIARPNAHKVIAGAQIDFGEELRIAQAIQKLVDAGKWIAILDGDPVEAVIVNAEAKRAVLLLSEGDRCAERRAGGPNEAARFVVLDEFEEIFAFHLGEAVNWQEGWCDAFLEVDRVVVGPMRRQFARRDFGEDVTEVMIDLWDVRQEVRRVFRRIYIDNISSRL